MLILDAVIDKYLETKNNTKANEGRQGPDRCSGRLLRLRRIRRDS